MPYWHPELKSFIESHRYNHTYDTRRIEENRIPINRVNADAKGFQKNFISFWNKLPRHLKLQNNINTFKNNLVDYLKQN